MKHALTIRRSRDIYYFDALAGAVVLGIVARAAAVARADITTWSRTGLIVWAFLAATALWIVCRHRTYRQRVPWIAGLFSLAAVPAIIVLFWPLPVVWFAATLSTGCAVILLALVLRRKPISEPVSRIDVFKVFAAVASVGLALVMIELGLRTAPGILGEGIRPVLVADRSEYGVPHDYIGYLHRPNGRTVITGSDFRAVHAVDEAGFRNTWPWPDPADVVVVGDSVTFGYGAETAEAWPAIVAAGLPNSGLVNLALIGAGPQQYSRVYETFGLKLQPKLVLVGVFAGNDYWDAEMFQRWLDSGIGGNYMIWRDFGQPGPLTLSLSDLGGSLSSLFDRYAYPALRTSRTYNVLRAVRAGLGSDLSQGSSYVDFDDGHRMRLLTHDFREKSRQAVRGALGFQLTFEALQRLQALAAANGTHVLMVLQPSKEEVYVPLLESDAPDPTKHLREAFDGRGIEYLDLGPPFRARAAAGARLFFDVDGHPNPGGYALTAQLVLAHLLEHADRYGLDSAVTGSVRAAGGAAAPPETLSHH